jgi:hypothetical protein
LAFLAQLLAAARAHGQACLCEHVLDALRAAELAQLLTSRSVAPLECAYLCQLAALLALEQLV